LPDLAIFGLPEAENPYGRTLMQLPRAQCGANQELVLCN